MNFFYSLLFGLALILLGVLLSGCAGLPPRTYSLYGQDRDGNKIGGSVTLGDTRGLAK